MDASIVSNHWTDVVVVKVGGSTLGSHDTSIEDVVRLTALGRRVVLVHGGGKTITDWLARSGVPSQFVRGLRVTDAASLDVVVAVLAGLVNKQLVGQLTAAGARAVGVSGADGGMLRVRQADQALGYVGEIERVDPQLLIGLLAAGFLPVVAPVGIGANGQLFNVNGDTAAGAIAKALVADRLVFLTDVDGVRDSRGQVRATLSPTEVATLVASGEIAGGMIPKVEAGLSSGCTAVIVDGRAPGAVLDSVSARPRGTLLCRAEVTPSSS